MTGSPRLVCFAGVSGAGKDTAGAYLTERHRFVRVAVADPMKDVMMQLFGLSREQLWGDARNLPDPRLGRPPRELYQQFGAACRDIDPEVWIRSFRSRVAALLAEGHRVVCTDLRTSGEWKAARELGGTVWLLERPGAGAPDTMAADATETDLSAAGADRFDGVIANEGSVAELHARIEAALTVHPG